MPSKRCRACLSNVLQITRRYFTTGSIIGKRLRSDVRSACKGCRNSLAVPGAAQQIYKPQARLYELSCRLRGDRVTDDSHCPLLSPMAAGIDRFANVDASDILLQLLAIIFFRGRPEESARFLSTGAETQAEPGTDQI